MTREEAIRIIETVFQDEYVYKYYDSITHQALDMAIEALKQVTGKLNNPDDSLLTADSEACKEQKSKLDLISRQAAIDAIEIVDWYHQNSNKDMIHGANDEHQAWYKAQDICKALEAVPSVNRPKDGDLISRTETIEALGEEPPVWCDEEGEIAERNQWRADIEAIKSVPSADRPRGRWHYSDGKPATIGQSFGVICDQCGTESEYCTNFCGECGADMQGDTERY